MKTATWKIWHLTLLAGGWLVLDYRLYALIWRRGYPAVALALVIAGLLLARRNRIREVRLRRPEAPDWKVVGVTLAALAATLIPLALSLSFIQFNPSLPQFRRALIEALPIYLIVALPEEIIFRGLIQKTLQDRTGSSALAVTIASALFGLAHLHKGSPFPNWRYALLAALAGAGYGLAFRRRGLMASSITHALLDVIWRAFFRLSAG
ncbi:MAG TPA: CPBP family intramembrane glutamic endopeptidase [Blastocatellia bacterium]|nr:CPBP family intramembrane glutamic endopeptidase [Blastocatellia bacterium]